MVYYVVRVRDHQCDQALVLVLNSGEDLWEQVTARLGTSIQILSIQILGCDWP